jgi:hypothetical protein
MESLKRESNESCKRCGSAPAHRGKGFAFPGKAPKNSLRLVGARFILRYITGASQRCFETSPSHI